MSSEALLSIELSIYYAGNRQEKRRQWKCPIFWHRESADCYSKSGGMFFAEDLTGLRY
jgi:hypothetical protein